MLILNALLMVGCYRANGEIAVSLKPKATDDGIILQSHPVSCVAACIANVSTIAGKPLSEANAVDLIGTTTNGTALCGARYGLWKLGISFHTLEAKHNELNRVRPPAILVINHPMTGADSHAVLYRRRRGEEFELWDPLAGQRFVTQKQIARHWNGIGIACHVPQLSELQ